MTCEICKKPIKDSVFTDRSVCVPCFDQESKRHQQDKLPNGPFFSRPPKYILDPKDYKKFGY